MNTPQEFDELYRALTRIDADGGTGAALVTIVRTRGSTFRRAGARMLVAADGTVVRGLSGGCPERDIIAHARNVIATGMAKIVRYDHESGFDVMLEMGCGGELDVLIEPVACGARARFLDWVAQLFARRGSGWLATVFAVDGACLVPGPVHVAFVDGDSGDGCFVGASTGNNNADDDAVAAVCDLLIAALRQRIATETTDSHAAVHRFEINGRAFDVLIERLVPPHALTLIGVNASSLALAHLAVQLGWRVAMVDPRATQGLSASPPEAVAHVQADADTLRDRVAADARASVVVMTHHLERDIAFLTGLRDERLAYLGALGSRDRAARLRHAVGSTATPLHAPAGLDIGSETPEEIALAIASEIVAVLAGRSGVPLSGIAEAIH